MTDKTTPRFKLGIAFAAFDALIVVIVVVWWLMNTPSAAMNGQAANRAKTAALKETSAAPLSALPSGPPKIEDFAGSWSSTDAVVAGRNLSWVRLNLSVRGDIVFATCVPSIGGRMELKETPEHTLAGSFVTKSRELVRVTGELSADHNRLRIAVTTAKRVYLVDARRL